MPGRLITDNMAAAFMRRMTMADSRALRVWEGRKEGRKVNPAKMQFAPFVIEEANFCSWT
eukprot:1085310-Amphidinium_carterae.1